MLDKYTQNISEYGQSDGQSDKMVEGKFSVFYSK